MKNIRIFYLKYFPFLLVKFSIYLNRGVFGMDKMAYANSADSDQTAQSDQGLHC